MVVNFEDQRSFPLKKCLAKHLEDLGSHWIIVYSEVIDRSRIFFQNVRWVLLGSDEDTLCLFGRC